MRRYLRIVLVHDETTQLSNRLVGHLIDRFVLVHDETTQLSNPLVTFDNFASVLVHDETTQLSNRRSYKVRGN